MSDTEKSMQVPLGDEAGKESMARSSLEAGVPAQPKPQDEFPEGGVRGWLVTFGASLGLFATFGYANAFG
jgi:MCP family monocarboxylic acid transporter-like MFS transporter 10